jgi:AP endonuclease-2
VINVYCPRADPEKPDRMTYKLQFFKLLELRAHNLRKMGDRIIILGDINQSHKEIDHCDPYEV